MNEAGGRMVRRPPSELRAAPRVAAACVVACAACGCSAYRYEAFPPHVHAACGDQHADHAVVRLMYATDRGRFENTWSEYFGPDRTRGVNWGGCEVTIPLRHGRGRLEHAGLGRPRPNRDVLLQNIRALRQEEFIAETRRRLALSPRKELLVFIHGFANTFESAARRAAQIAHDTNFEGVPMIYSWPAQGSLLSYLVDADNAEWSAAHLSETLNVLAHESGAERIHLMAHSMGTQVLTRGMREYAADHRRGDMPDFDQIILAASDMDAELFQRDYLRHLLRCGRRLTVYVSGADWALGGSRRLHRYSRLGQLDDPGRMIAMERVDVVDATECDRGLIGHSYYGDSPAILDDLSRVLAGESVTQRGLSGNRPHRIALDAHLKRDDGGAYAE